MNRRQLFQSAAACAVAAIMPKPVAAGMVSIASGTFTADFVNGVYIRDGVRYDNFTDMPCVRMQGNARITERGLYVGGKNIAAP